MGENVKRRKTYSRVVCDASMLNCIVVRLRFMNVLNKQNAVVVRGADKKFLSALSLVRATYISMCLP